MSSERPAPSRASATSNVEDASADAHEQQASASSIPPAADEAKSEPPGEPKEAKRGRFESRLPGLIRRGIEKGIEAGLSTFERSIETGRETTDAVREVIGDVKIPDIASAVGKALQEAKLPRELASLVFTQLDEARTDVVRIIAREVKDFLEATDLASEIKAALTSLSFEVRTEVRFIPNDAGTGVRPNVRARGRVKRSTARERRGGKRERGRADPAPKHDPDDESEL